MAKSKIDKKHIKKLQGREFIMFAGLLEAAHSNGLKSTEVEMLQAPSPQNDHTAIMKATVETTLGTFQDIGDANPSNVNGTIVPHIIRMASTRALARALRQATNIGMTAYEEILDHAPVPQTAHVQSKPATATPEQAEAEMMKRKKTGAKMLNQMWVKLVESGVDGEELAISAQEFLGEEFPYIPVEDEDLVQIPLDKLTKFHSVLKRWNSKKKVGRR